MTLEEEKSPFVPGIKVAIYHYARWDHSREIRSSVVEKVYKNGRFTLVGDTNYNGRAKQYIPRLDRFWGDDNRAPRWEATETGYRNSGTIHLWDERVEKDILADRAIRAHQRRCKALEDAWNKSHTQLSPLLSQQVCDLMVCHAICGTAYP